MTRNQPAADSRQTFRLPLHRSMVTHSLSLGVLALLAAATLWQPRGAGAQAQPTPDSVAFYAQRVQPIFAGHCYGCHGGAATSASLRAPAFCAEGWMAASSFLETQPSPYWFD